MDRDDDIIQLVFVWDISYYLISSCNSIFGFCNVLCVACRVAVAHQAVANVQEKDTMGEDKRMQNQDFVGNAGRIWTAQDVVYMQDTSITRAALALRW